MKHILLRGLSTALVSFIALSASLTANAEGFKYPEIKEDRASGLTITPMIGGFSLDEDRGFDDTAYAGIGIGYRFTDPYMVEFVYLTGDADNLAGVSQGDLRQFRIEMLYDITDNESAFQPYIALGGASTEFGDNRTINDDEGALTFGIGARYHFSEAIALRGDLRHLRTIGDGNEGDLSYGLGLQFFLGGNKEKPKEVAVVEPAAKPAPAPAPTFAELCAQAGGIVEAANCVKKSIVTERINLNVQFEYNSDKVRSEYLSEIAEFSDFLKSYPSATVVIEGHTDSTGSDAYNQNLSQRRVNEVVRLLINDYGVNPDSLSALGFGETQPIAPNDTDANRAKNRRVVASVTVEIEETLSLDVK